MSMEATKPLAASSPWAMVGGHASPLRRRAPNAPRDRQQREHVEVIEQPLDGVGPGSPPRAQGRDGGRAARMSRSCWLNVSSACSRSFERRGARLRRDLGSFLRQSRAQALLQFANLEREFGRPRAGLARLLARHLQFGGEQDCISGVNDIVLGWVEGARP